MTPDTVIASMRNLRRAYDLGGEVVWALDDVSLDVYRGEYLSIMGPSGSGKSTLFNMIGGLDRPTEGSVHIDGNELSKLNKHQLAHLRSNHIGYIFQTFNLVDVMTALQNVMLPMVFAGKSDEDCARRGKELLALVGLADRADHRPIEMSGGQQQRVAVARALANHPRIILADEPTGNLDLTTGEEIIQLLNTLKTEFGVTVISATHDHKMLAASDRVVHMDAGKIARIQSRDQLHIRFGSIKEGTP